jgi:phosphate starvation-inducible PhoH-like protein
MMMGRAAICMFSLPAVASLNPFATALRKLSLTPNQSSYLDALRDNDVSLVVSHGPAGTGKSALAVLHGLSELRKKTYTKLVLTRPTLLVDNADFGALPGGVDDKMGPLMEHIAEIAREADGVTAATYSVMKEKAVEVVPLEYVRGRTFKNSLVLLDEAQNASPRQMKALLTRIGQDSKLVVCGDLQQSDFGDGNGLEDFLSRWKLFSERNGSRADMDVSSVAIASLDVDDVKRSALVRMILNCYT